MPSFHDFRFLSTDGKHKVFARECTPDGEVRAVLQIAHGVAEHVYRYAPFMEFLANNGFVVVANDHLGHGKTAENEQELCFFAEKDGWNDVVSDMDQLHKLTAAKYPDVPYFLFGHSMGSFLTRTYIMDHPEGLKGVIISGTGQNPAAVVAAGKLMAKLEMIDNEGVKKVYNRFLKVGCKDVKLKLYKDGRHEMLNELNRDEVYADILDWLNSKI